MKFSLRIKKTYTTPLTQDEIITYVRSRRGKTRSVYCKVDYFGGYFADRFEVDIHQGNFWIFRRPYRWGIESRVKVSGRVASANPTKLELVISPPYSVIFLSGLFVLALFCAAIMIDSIAVDDVQPEIYLVRREARLLDRLHFLIPAPLPVLLYYFFVHIPIQKTERWLVDKLKLTEVEA